jgi:uncharacterized protein YuzE
MKIRYAPDSDRLSIEFRDARVTATRALDERTSLALDAQGHVCRLTLEHARERTDVEHIVFEATAG